MSGSSFSLPWTTFTMPKRARIVITSFTIHQSDQKVQNIGKRAQRMIARIKSTRPCLAWNFTKESSFEARRGIITKGPIYASMPIKVRC